MKRVLRILAVVGTLVIGAAALAVVVTQTAWFKEWAKGLIVRQANNYLNAELSIGRLTGNLFFGAALNDVVVRQNGQTAIAVQRVGLDYSVIQLLTDGLVIDDIRLSGPVVHLVRTADGWNLARLVKEQEQEAEREGPARPVTIRSIRIEDGSVRIDGGGERVPERIDRLQARLGFAYEPVNFTIDIGQLSFVARGPDLALESLSGRIATKGDELHVDDVSVRTARSALALEGLVGNYTGTPELALTASSPRVVLAEFAPLVPALRGIEIQPSFEIRARGPADDLALAVQLESAAGRIRADLEADVLSPRRRAAGTATLRAVDLGALLGRPSLASDLTGRVKFDLTMPGSDAGLDALTGTWQIEAERAAIAGYEARRLVARGQLDRGTLLVDGRALAYGGSATVDGRVRLAAPVRLDLSGRARDIDLRNLPPQLAAPAVASDLSLRYHVRGTLGDRPDLRADLRFQDSSFAGARIGEGSTASVTLGDRGPAYTADAQVADLNLRAIGRALEIEALDRDLLETTLNGHVVVDGRGTSLAGLQIEASGTLADSRALGGTVPSLAFTAQLQDGRLAADLEGMFLGIDPAVLGAPPRFAGSVNGMLDVRAAIDDLAAGITPEDVDVAGRIVLEDAVLGDLQLRSLTAQGEFANGAGRLDTLEVNGPAIEASGSGRVAVSGDAQNDFTLKVAHADLDALGELAGQAELAGSAQLEAHVTGTVDSLRAQGTLEVSRLDHPQLSALELESHFDAVVPSLDIQQARITADTNATLVEVAGRKLTNLQAKTTYAGERLEFQAALRERERALELGGDLLLHPDHQEVHLRQLRMETGGVGWETPPQTEAVVQYGNGRIDVRDFELMSGPQRIRAEGTFGEPGASLVVDAEQVDLAALDQLLMTESRVAGTLNAHAEISGTTEQPAIEGRFDVQQGAFRDFQYQQLTGTVDYDAAGAHLDARLEQSAGSVLTAKGFVPRAAIAPADPPPVGMEADADEHQVPPPGQGLDLQVRTEGMDLGVVQGFVPQLTEVAGTLRADVRVSGTVRDPHFGGFVEVRDGAFTVADLTPDGYTGLDTRITLAPDRIEIDEFRILDEHGQPLTIGGQLAFHQRQVGQVQITLRSDGFEVVDNDLADIKLDTDLRITGQLRRPAVEGAITVDSGTIYLDRVLELVGSDPYPTNQGPGLGPGVQPVAQTTPAAAPDTAPAADAPAADPGRAVPPGSDEEPAASGFGPVALNVRLEIPNNLVVKGAGLNPGGTSPVALGDVNVTLGGDLRVTKAAGEPISIVGVVNTVRGTYDFQGRRFQIARDGRIQFTGGDEINPRLDLEATRVISGVQTSVQVRGTVRAPELALSSQPPLDEADILSLIVFNQPVNALGEGEQISLAQRAGALASGFVASTLANSIGDALELDIFEIQTTATNGGGATVTLGEQIGQRLFLKFRQGLGAQAVSEFLIEYALTEYLRLQSSISQGGASSERTLMQRYEQGGIDLILFFSY